MATPSLLKLVAAAGGLALSLTSGIGIASAGPDLGPIVNSTCNYSQVMSALTAENPEAAAKFNENQGVQALLRTFLAASPEKRERMALQIQSLPEAQQYMGTIVSVANSCSSY